MRLYSLSLRQRVRFVVPNLCINATSSVDQGAVLENHVDSCWRASSQVMPDFIASESGHLTQNHVVSSRSPRIYGNQLSSSVAGIRSGLVNTPVKSHHLLLLKKDIPNVPTVLSPQGLNCRASRCAPWLTKSAAFPSQKKVLCSKRDLLSQATVRRTMQLGFLMYSIARSFTSCISCSSSPPTNRPR